MLHDANVQPMLPVQDLERARRFYREALGLEEVEVLPDMAAVYRSGSTTLCVYQSEYAGTNRGTAALWEVPDVRETVEELRSRGIVFEEYDDLPDVTREGAIHRAGEITVAWFKDPAGNILSIQNTPPA